jgi:hypothetical protein
LTGLAANWRMQGISSLRSFWALTTLGRLTDESESGSSDAWATAGASAAHGPSQAEIEAGDPRHRLETAVMCQWPTPRASDENQASRPRIAQRAGQLREAVHWATPRAGTVTNETPEAWAARHAAGQVATPPLGLQVNWATPMAGDAYGNHGGGMGRSLRTDTAQSPGQLHPAFCECLMGYPVGWTDVGPPDRAKRSTRGSRRAQGTASPTEPPA